MRLPLNPEWRASWGLTNNSARLHWAATTGQTLLQAESHLSSFHIFLPLPASHADRRFFYHSPLQRRLRIFWNIRGGVFRIFPTLCEGGEANLFPTIGIHPTRSAQLHRSPAPSSASVNPSPRLLCSNFNPGFPSNTRSLGRRTHPGKVATHWKLSRGGGL